MSLSKNPLLLFTDLVNQHSEMYNHQGPESKKQSYFDTRSVRNSLIPVLIASVLLAYLLIILSPVDKKALLIDMIKPTSAEIATAFSLVVVYRQKTDGIIGKAFTLLAAGLTLFLIGELISSYNDIALGIENALPSIIYHFWTIAYDPIFFFVFKMYYFLGASHSKTHKISICIVRTVFLTYFITLTSQNAEFSTQRGIASFLISIAYPVLDVVLIVPSALILLNPVKGSLTSIPWIFLAVLILGIGDSIFAYTFNVRAMEDLNWISKLFFITSYVIAAGGLFWHNKFFICNQK
jgi:hypothetical protein